jgi:two-component system OmpR family sensor kinase
MTLGIRTRLTVWYVAALTGMIVALGAFLLVRMRTGLTEVLDEGLRAGAIFGHGWHQAPSSATTLTEAVLLRLPAHESAVQVLSPAGEVLELAGDEEAREPMVTRAVLGQARAGPPVLLTAVANDDSERFRILASAMPDGSALVIGTSLEEVDRAVGRLVRLLLVAGPAVLVAAAAGGWFLARRALDPVTRMREAAEQIGVERLHQRVQVPKAEKDDLGRLARTLNAMLTRIEDGVESKRRFVADASHELRTPLAIMQAELDVSLRSPTLGDGAREVLESTREEAERMRRIVDDLLTLARIDEGKLELLREPVDLHALATRVVGEMRPLAQAGGLEVKVDGSRVGAWADRQRLEQVVRNLLDNGFKHSPPGSAVTVSVWDRPQEVGLTVTDAGPGIPEEALPHVFDRFFRVDTARSRGDGGSGLGLAICREIAEAHGGSVSVRSVAGRGSAFSLTLPALRPKERRGAPLPGSHAGVPATPPPPPGTQRP